MDSATFSARFDYPNLDTAMAFLSSRPGLFIPEFAQWVKDNWQIYREFHQRADRLWDAGRRHYSARTIMEAIRFDTDLRETNSEFKINNSFIPDCARLYLLYQSGRDEFFHKRQSLLRAA